MQAIQSRPRPDRLRCPVLLVATAAIGATWYSSQGGPGGASPVVGVFTGELPGWRPGVSAPADHGDGEPQRRGSKRPIGRPAAPTRPVEILPPRAGRGTIAMRPWDFLSPLAGRGHSRDGPSRAELRPLGGQRAMQSRAWGSSIHLLRPRLLHHLAVAIDLGEHEFLVLLG